MKLKDGVSDAPLLLKFQEFFARSHVNAETSAKFFEAIQEDLGIFQTFMLQEHTDIPGPLYFVLCWFLEAIKLVYLIVTDRKNPDYISEAADEHNCKEGNEVQHYVTW